MQLEYYESDESEEAYTPLKRTRTSPQSRSNSKSNLSSDSLAPPSRGAKRARKEPAAPSPSSTAASPSIVSTRTRPVRGTAKTNDSPEVPKCDWKALSPSATSVLISSIGDPQPSSKIAAFDLDDTLVCTESGKKFAISSNDWKWLFPTIPAALSDLVQEGYRIVIISNQAGIEKDPSSRAMITGKVANVMAALQIPITATAKDHYRKPSPLMWHEFISLHNSNVSLQDSFYVGDAAGRVDLLCRQDGRQVKRKTLPAAIESLQQTFKLPEEMFAGSQLKSLTKFEWGSFDPKSFTNGTMKLEGSVAPPLVWSQELVLMVGFPASGKSTFSKNYLGRNGYVVVNRDTLKTQAKCIAEARRALANKKSVVIDNTNPDIAAREQYIKLAQEFSVPVRAFVMSTPLELALHLNKCRAIITRGAVSVIPMIAYHTFKKKFTLPQLSEGIQSIETVKFEPKFESEQDAAIFNYWTEN